MVIFAAPSVALSSAARRSLRARAHALSAVVTVGDAGLTDLVLREIDVSLKAHELIKVRVSNNDHGAREALMRTICSKLRAEPVQHVGKILVVYRRRQEQGGGRASNARRTRPTKRSFQGHSPR